MKVLFARLQDFYILCVISLLDVFRRPFYGRTVVEQMNYIGAGSFLTVSIVSLFIGMVLSLQLSANLAPLGLKEYTGKAVGLSIIREIGPVSVALAFAGRVGSGISSEIGSMVLGHQVDVMRVHGISPLKRLVKPRVLSALIMLPVLTILGDALALIGGFYIAVFESTQSGAFYWMQISQIINIESLLLGLSKPILFGYLVACISCYMGLSTKGGAKGLRKTTTEAVVFSTLMIIVSDFLVTKLILFITRGAG